VDRRFLDALFAAAQVPEDAVGDTGGLCRVDLADGDFLGGAAIVREDPIQHLWEQSVLFLQELEDALTDQ